MFVKQVHNERCTVMVLKILPRSSLPTYINISHSWNPMPPCVPDEGGWLSTEDRVSQTVFNDLYSSECSTADD